jgi:membrane protease YdiL (CAAX protease family)
MHKRPVRQSRDFLLPFFLLAYALTWGLGIFAIFFPRPFEALFGQLTDTSPLYFLAVAAPTISATVFTLWQQGWTGLAALYKRLVNWRFGIRWYAFMVIGIPVLGWLASRFTGIQPLKPATTTAEFLLLLVYVLVTGPLCEELGWRGFALPRLLKRFNPLVASLILGAIWGVWHLPAFFLGGMVQAGMSIPVFILFTIPAAVVATWIFQHSGGSVLSAVLFHYMINIAASVIGVPPAAMGASMLVVAILAVTFDKGFGWFRKGQTWTLDSQHLPTAPASPTM